MFTHPPRRVKERSKYKAQKKAEAFLYDHPQQPTDVVTGCAQHGVNPVTSFTLQMAPIHSVVMLQMPDHGLNRLAALQQSQFRFVQLPLFAAMIDLYARMIVIDAAIPSASLQLPVLTAAAYESLAEDELVVRRRLELEAAETLARIRELVGEGDWDGVESLLQATRTKYGSSPWLADVLTAMSALAAQREDASLMKEMAYFRVVANSRLAESCERAEVGEQPDIPSFLRRKVRQGEGS